MKGFYSYSNSYSYSQHRFHPQSKTVPEAPREHARQARPPLNLDIPCWILDIFHFPIFNTQQGTYNVQGNFSLVLCHPEIFG